MTFSRMDLELRDKWNTKVRLSLERIKHIANHMGLHDKIHLIEETLQYPDKVTEDEEQENVYFYQKYLREEGLFIVIVVKKSTSDAFIITIFKSKKPKQT